MKMREILLDSMKYPLLSLKPFFLMGLMILISSFLVSRYFDFNGYFENTLGIVGLVIVILLTFLIVIIATVLESGYTFKVVEKSLMGIEKPPEVNNFLSMFKHGFNEIVVGLIYFLIPLALFLVILDTIFTQINFGLAILPENHAILFLIPLMILGFISDIIFMVALPHMAFKGGAFKEAFRFSEMFEKIRQIGLKKLLIGYFIVLLGVVAVGLPVLKEVIGSINIVGFVIAELIIAPYFLMFSARFTALIYKSADS